MSDRVGTSDKLGGCVTEGKAEAKEEQFSRNAWKGTRTLAAGIHGNKNTGSAFTS